MYEEATVLNYGSKKIWVKHINESLYCVNGRYIVFNPRQDLSDVVLLATAHDQHFNPMDGFVPEDQFISFESSPKDSESFIMGGGSLSNCMFDTSMAKTVVEEFKAWEKTVSESDIYIDNGRNMSIPAWIKRQNDKGKGVIFETT